MTSSSTSNRSSSSSDFLVIDAPHDEFLITRLPRRHFVADLIAKSFPVSSMPPAQETGRPQQQAANRAPSSSSSTSSSTSNVDDEGFGDVCLDSDLGDIGLSPEKHNSGGHASRNALRVELDEAALHHVEQRGGSDTTFLSSLDGDVSRLVSDRIWPAVWKQFVADVGREVFTIESQRFCDPDDAFRAVVQLMQTAIVQRVLTASQQLQQHSAPTPVSAPISATSRLTDGRSGGDIPAATEAPHHVLSRYRDWIASTGSSWLRHFVPERWHRRVRRELGRFTMPSPGSSSSSSDPDLPDASSEEVRFAAERMARLVVLLSQQSVMGLPYEELHKKYLANATDVVFLEADTATAGGMSVSLTAISPSTSTFPYHVSGSGSGGGAQLQEHRTTSLDDYYEATTTTLSRVMWGPPRTPPRRPPPPPAVPAASSSSPSSSSSTSSLLQPTLRIHKQFRVFTLRDEDECTNTNNDKGGGFVRQRSAAGHAGETMFYIDTELVVDLFAPEDAPILMLWSITTPSPRRVSTRLGRQTSPPAAVPAEASSLAPPPDLSERMTYIPASVSRLGSVANSEEPTNQQQQQQQQPHMSGSEGVRRRSESAPVACDCLGSSYGFHRVDCSHSTAARGSSSAER